MHLKGVKKNKVIESLEYSDQDIKYLKTVKKVSLYGKKELPVKDPLLYCTEEGFQRQIDRSQEEFAIVYFFVTRKDNKNKLVLCVEQEIVYKEKEENVQS